MKRRDKEQLMEGEWSHKYKKLNSFLRESNLSDSAVMEWRFISPRALVVAVAFCSYQVDDKETLGALLLFGSHNAGKTFWKHTDYWLVRLHVSTTNQLVLKVRVQWYQNVCARVCVCS